jgi:outer membrane protein TolC
VRIIAAILLGATLPGFSRAEATVFEMSFSRCRSDALSSSDRIRAAERDLEATRQRAGSQGGLMWPKLAVEGNYRYLDQIAELTPFPGRPPIALGAHDNYSIGPTVNWVVWDWGALYSGWKGAWARSDAKREELALIRRQVLFGATLTYAQVQLALETVNQLADAAKLADDQYTDISLRRKTGSASRIDELQAHQDSLTRRRQYAQARAELGAGLMDLFAQTGVGGTDAPPATLAAGAGRGLDASTPGSAGTNEGTPSLLVKLDRLEDTLAALEPVSQGDPDPAYPGVVMNERLADSARHASWSVTASRLPRITVTGKTSLDYPNGPVLEQIHQNMVGVAAVMPLFEGGRIVRDANEAKEQAKGFDERRVLARIELDRDWKKAAGRLAALREQKLLNATAVKETGELAGLTYDSYKSGQARFIEVQAANLRALDAKVQDARTKTEMIVQLAIMQSLAKEGDKP